MTGINKIFNERFSNKSYKCRYYKFSLEKRHVKGAYFKYYFINQIDYTFICISSVCYNSFDINYYKHLLEYRYDYNFKYYNLPIKR
jgi:hypothetical protein